MTKAHPTASTSGASRDDEGATAARDLAEWLYLVATPGFAVMALLTAVLDGAQTAIICSPGQISSPLGGMVSMYLLMGTFHSAPWLRLIANRRRGARKSCSGSVSTAVPGWAGVIKSLQGGPPAFRMGSHFRI